METRFRNPAGRAGFFGHLLALIDALVCFFESRFALFSKESKAALARVLALLLLVVIALLFFAFRYIFSHRWGGNPRPHDGACFVDMDRIDRCGRAYSVGADLPP